MHGSLDVDIINPNGVAVENIIFPDKGKMIDGEYKFMVKNYTHRGGTSGFRAEIEFNGTIYQYDYSANIKDGDMVDVAVVTLKNGEFSIKHRLPSNETAKEVWGLKTQNFHPVTVAMYSPNHWDGQSGIGHKHYMFMLNGCVNSERPNGFFNEYLTENLMKHKRVFEALGSKMKCADSDNQLSGLGFSTTKRNAFVCRVKGTFNRMLKVLI